MRKTILLLLILSLTLAIGLFPLNASAHGGGTDSNGGHYDSTTGIYHYHHGYPAHSHKNGVCPFDSSYSKADNSSGASGIWPVMIMIIIVLIIIALFKMNTTSREKKDSPSKFNSPSEEACQHHTNISTSSYREESPLLKEYEKSFQSIIALPVVKKCKNYRPLTAAILYVFSDLFLIDLGEERIMRSKNSEATTIAMQRRYLYAALIFRHLEGILDDGEISIFNDAAVLLANIGNGDIELRADWCGSYPAFPDRRLFIFYAYGDLMWFPNYLDDYEHAKMRKDSIDNSATFVKDFFEVFDLLTDFTDRIDNKDFRDAL